MSNKKRKNPLPPTSPRLLRFVTRISGGEVKTEKEAIQVVVAFIVLCFVLIGILFLKRVRSQQGNDYAPPAEVNPPAENSF